MERKEPYLLYAMMVLCLVGILLTTMWQTTEHEEPISNGLHFVLIVPELDHGQEQLRATMDVLEKTYDLQLEFHAFPTTVEQRQLLRVLQKTDVDGVLLWPISANDEDYEDEMEDLQTAEIPIVVIERDVAQNLRSSFIGSGYSSDLLVLNQSLPALENGERFVVGNRFGSGERQVVELLFFKRGEKAVSLPADLQDIKLQQFAKEPPEGYYIVDYWRLEGAAARSLQLKQSLSELFSGPQAPGLFFSLDSTLSATAVSAKRSVGQSGDCAVRLLCYGEESQNRGNLEEGLLNGLVTLRPDVSVTIGIRYLRDICRKLWVPATMDSGITFLTAEDLGRSS